MMQISDDVKSLTLEEIGCGVMSLETRLPCNETAFTLVTIEEYGAVICLCGKHAVSVMAQGESVIVQELSVTSSKRYFGIEMTVHDIETPTLG
jgi:hypothetical protein